MALIAHGANAASDIDAGMGPAPAVGDGTACDRVAAVRGRRLLVRVLLAALALFTGAPARAESGPAVTGVWNQVDHATGNVGALVTFAENGGVFEGRISKLFSEPGEDSNPICKKCAGDKRGKPVLGLVFIEGMKRSGLEYSGGTILDPDTGDVYSANMRLSPDGKSLEVRGYLGISLFGRTQVWTRVE